jgi:hypothetical protein
MQILAYLIYVALLVCWIMVLIPTFKENVLYGILGILCGLFAFVWGWVRVKQYGIKNVMVAWTILGVALTPLNNLNLMSAPDPQ